MLIREDTLFMKDKVDFIWMVLEDMADAILELLADEKICWRSKNEMKAPSEYCDPRGYGRPETKKCAGGRRTR